MLEVLSDFFGLKAPEKSDFSVPESLFNNYTLREKNPEHEQVMSYQIVGRVNLRKWASIHQNFTFED